MTFIYEVICSFRTMNQVILDDIIIPANTTQTEFLNLIFKELLPEELLDLVKFSCYQKVQSNNENILPFILGSNGKYYFNPDINQDQETLEWYQLRNKFVTDMLHDV